VTLADIVTRLRDSGVPCGAVRSIGDALADPQTRAREMVQQVLHPTLGPIQVIGVPVKLSDTPGSVRTAPPLLNRAQEPSTTKDTKITKS
jgi:formyl-CoA transferase/CoA:oxalate CoA-transferase